MNNNIVGILVFLLMLTLYTTVLIAVSSVLPFIFLVSLVAWLIIRRPMMYPGRVERDLRQLELKTGEVVYRLMEMLVRPLSQGL